MATEETFGELVPLGEGPVATVLAAVDETSGQAYALKVFPGRIDRRTRAELDAELAILHTLRATVPVLAADGVEDTPDGRSALRMELCAQSLSELISSFGPLSVPDALALGEALAGALAATHRAGLVHGAVTPGNVLFRPSGEAVLSDAGLALRRVFPPDPIRALDFLPPETVRDGSADERSDLYGLGAILHLALSGVSPHQGKPGEQEGERVLRVLATPVPPLERPDLPPGLAQLVSSLLEKNADARPLDATSVATRLGSLTRPSAPARQDSAFDDFAAVAAPPAATGWPPPPGPAEQTQPVPRVRATHPAPSVPSVPSVPQPKLGEPVLVYGPKQPRKRRSRRAPVLVVIASLSVLAVAAVLLLVRTPREVTEPPPSAQIGGQAVPDAAQPDAAQLELLDPVDQGNFVELSWRSSETLDYAIIVVAEGAPQETVYAHRKTSHRLPVDPVLGYCFLVQGINSNGVVTESQPKPIRDAECG
ncbi:protein kinase [Prauserella sp. ASG 168]|uniref:Protein kinase n=2 Tax=Prauserella cavernicola TaxID=2800127 RepID=A0A934V554_9PSEU|nr:protein kinase [Prauserella cavernicola]